MGTTVKWLIKYGADINCRNHNGDTPLIVAATHGSLKAIEALTGASGVEYNASNNKNVTAFETSIKLRNQKVCEKLMAHDKLTRYGYRSMKESLEVDIKERDMKILELNRANLQLKIEKKEALDKANKQCELVSNAANGILEIANFFLIQKKRLRADDSKMFLEKVKGIDTSSKASRMTKKERLQMVSKMLEQLSDQLDVKL
jgi:ankyrin repeat protein